MRHSLKFAITLLIFGTLFLPLAALETPQGEQDAVVYIYRSPPDKLFRGYNSRFDIYLNTTRVSSLTDRTFTVFHLKPGTLLLKVKSVFGTPTQTLTAIGNQILYFRIDTLSAQKAILLSAVSEQEAIRDMVGMIDRREKIPRVFAYDPKAKAPSSTVKPALASPRDTSGPEISIVYPDTKRGLSVVASSRVQRVEGLAKDAKGVYEIQVNGIQASLKGDGSFIVEVPLAVGENILEVVARDTLMNETRKSFTVNRPADATASNSVSPAPTTNQGVAPGAATNSGGGQNYLLVIAINKYKFWPQLGNAVKDAQDVISLLTARYQFTKSNVIEIYDEKATVDNIYNGFRELAGKLTERDNLMIYFSGHGNYDKLLDEGFWIPVEARKNNNTDFLPNSTISKLINAIPTKHTFLVADACFSGSLFASGSRGYVENVEQYKSRWGLTSGRLEFVSDGRSGENSPFATYILKYLRTNTKDAPVSELVQYVKTSVGNNSEQTPVGASLRNVGDEGGEFVFHLRK